jgi:DNA repair protein SbcD/Mre11
VRVLFEGTCPADRELRGDPIHWTNEVRNSAIEVSRDRAWVEKVQFHTSEPRETNASWTEDGPLGELVRFLDELAIDEAALAKLALLDELADFKKKLKSEQVVLPTFGNSDWLREALSDLKPLLIKRLEG